MKTFKVITAEILHETNTFNKHTTDLNSFKSRCFFEGVGLIDKSFNNYSNEGIKQRFVSNTELAGFTDIAVENNWSLVHAISAHAEPSGVVKGDTIKDLIGYVTKAFIDFSTNDEVGGVLLALHGSMVTEIDEDGDAYILESIRQIIGNDIPIVATLDLHANVTKRMCKAANALVSYKTYPHVDMRDTGKHAAIILQGIMVGAIIPKIICLSIPMLEESNSGRTDVGPMVERIKRMQDFEKEPGVLAVSINAGFPTDVTELGPTVVLCYDSKTIEPNDLSLKEFVSSLAMSIWSDRHNIMNSFISVEDAACIAKNHSINKKANEGPLVIADYADNPGGGAYGDSTNLLRALLDAGVTDCALGPIVDGEVASLLCNMNVGDSVSVHLGGKADPRFGGGPLFVHGTIQFISISGAYKGDGPIIGGLECFYGPTVVLKVDSIEILIVSEPSQILDQQQFRAFGINLDKLSVIAVKSMQHFRAAFISLAHEIIVCDSGALCTADMTKLIFKNVPRPIFPLDKDFEYSI